MNLFELGARALLTPSNPVGQLATGGRMLMGLAGRFNDDIAIARDSAENAIGAFTGRRQNRGPDQYLPRTQAALGRAIERADARGADKDKEGYMAIQYEDYADNPAARLVTGRMNARINPDGTYEIAPEERYDYNAPGNDQAYFDRMRGATTAAFGRGDIAGGVANLADEAAYLTGAGREGFTIGGAFGKPQAASSPIAKPTPQMSPMDPAYYTVKSGDTLGAIANQMGVSVEELAKRNQIANPNLINVGQRIR